MSGHLHPRRHQITPVHAQASTGSRRHTLRATSLRKNEVVDSPVEALREMLQNDEGRKALRIGLHSNKKTKIGSSMMDIIICGAIPPYAEMLGGKLVAMLMASPQVAREYQELYGNQAGEIASRVAGKDVIRPADLVFLTTTSLYHVGSSQYERIRIPGPRRNEIAFEHIGKRKGSDLPYFRRRRPIFSAN